MRFLSGKLQPRNKRRVSSESPKKKQSPPATPKRLPPKSPPPKPSESKSPSQSKSTTKLKSKSPCSSTSTEPSSSKPSLSENPPSGPESVTTATSSDCPEGKASQNLEQSLDQVESPQPIRLPTKSKSKPIESDSDSDSKSTKSSASSSCSKVARSFKKTFKGKAIAIVKPFSNPAPEKKSLDSKPVHESVESSTSSEVREGKFAESRMFFFILKRGR